MAPPTVRVRCPACGTELAAVVAPTPPTQWFPCPHCHLAVPVVVPRDPPPLYTWEVIPSLYPPLAPPRPPRWRTTNALVVALALVAVVSAAVAGGLVYYGGAASGSARYTISGTVYEALSNGAVRPAVGATVVLEDDRGIFGSNTTSFGGEFAFSGVPSGGVELRATVPGYAPGTIDTFVTPTYDAGSSGLNVTLYPTDVSNGTTVVESPFPTLESFLSSVYGGAALEGLAAVVAVGTAVALRRGRMRTAAVIGGGAGAGAPIGLLLLELSSAYPVLLVASALGAAVGVFAIGVGATELYRAGPATSSD